MRIRDNLASLMAWRSFNQADQEVSKSISRLSSGLRIQTAADSPADLGRYQAMQSQIRGLRQASKNALDGLSVAQTAEAALGEVHSLLQRGRELAVRAANGTLSNDDRRAVQTEMDEILAGIDSISDSTVSNGVILLNPGGNSSQVASVITRLRTGWLSDAEDLIKTQLGLIGDGTPMTIVIEPTGAQAAWVTGDPDPATGQWNSLTLHLNAQQLPANDGLDGGPGPFHSDRKVARAMAQALLSRNANMNGMSSWFLSGLPDYLVGGDELLLGAAQRYGVPAIMNALSTPWIDDELHQAAAYAATKYLHTTWVAPLPMSTFLDVVKISSDLSTAMNGFIGMDESSFLQDFKDNAGGYVNGLVAAINPSGVGGIGGGDAKSVVPNTPEAYTLSPLKGMDLVWKSNLKTSTTVIDIQVGANPGETIAVNLPVVNTMTLGVLGVDVTKDAASAIKTFDTALRQVSSDRAQLGSVSNRLERAVSHDTVMADTYEEGASRIADLDYAHEVANLTRHQILLQSAGAMVAQANTMRQNVLWLLTGLSGARA